MQPVAFDNQAAACGPAARRTTRSERALNRSEYRRSLLRRLASGRAAAESDEPLLAPPKPFECQDFNTAPALRLAGAADLASEWRALSASASGRAKGKDKRLEPGSLARTTSNLIDALRTAAEASKSMVPSDDKIRWWRMRQWPSQAAVDAPQDVKSSSRAGPSCAGCSQTIVNGESNSNVNCDRQQHGKVPTPAQHSGGHLSQPPALLQPPPPLFIGLNRGVGRRREPAAQASGGVPMLRNLAAILLLALIRLHEVPVVHPDPRPTIYSGQVSFGLLLSAHSSSGSELSTAASDAVPETLTTRILADEAVTPTLGLSKSPATSTMSLLLAGNSIALNQTMRETTDLELAGAAPAPTTDLASGRLHAHERRQKEQQAKLEQQAKQEQQARKLAPAEASCGQVNSNALYAGMGAIWASHQANLVGDSQLAIGTYVYDSCNDLDVGQRQAVRIVSNLNAFQQTTCESPRGSPISLTIAHGDNQLRAIQLLTSFKVPVITTREHFAFEDYQLLSREQRRFLFSTAPSSRHLAVGALKFSKRVVARSTSSAKLPNQFHKMSSKNGLIVISRNLPAKFLAYLAETIPNHVNYELLQSNQPIDQVRSLEALESILGGGGGLETGSSSASFSTGSQASASSESRRSERRLPPSPQLPVADRTKRSSSDDSETTAASSGAESESSDEQQQQQQQQSGRMLSPTILMFITPSEAIDLITRLRNDLAEVSKYYSLIVSTREDISPALRTIFHRGGSRLCSGKAFYTISPKPDEVSEFSRYFRDTVQLEGESSDHPLVCEFAKHAASSKTNADLDDSSTESVIKAVWSAAAAFKLVHKRECSASSAPTATGNVYTASGNDGADGPELTQRRAAKHGRQSGAAGQSAAATAGQSAKAAQAECLVKMNKNMATLVQRALKKLDVNINSTGLQALDGFRIKFDELNELLTNKYSIKYVNKECEITEIGQYSGLRESQLRLDEDTLLKSLESALPEPWPMTTPAPSTPNSPEGTTSNGSSSSTSSTPTDSSSASSSSSSNDEMPSGESSPSSSDGSSSGSSNDEPPDSDLGGAGGGGSGPPFDSDKMPTITLDSEAPKRRRSGDTSKPQRQAPGQQFAMRGGREGGLMPVVSDFYQPANAGDGRRMTTNGPSLRIRDRRPPDQPAAPTPVPTMRKLKPFPNNGAGATLREWLPREEQTTTMASTMVPTATTTTTTTTTTSTTRGPSMSQTNSTTSTEASAAHSPLPESGGNTDLEMPAFKRATTTKPAPSGLGGGGTSSARANRELPASSRAALEAAASSDASGYVTLPSSPARSLFPLLERTLQLEPGQAGQSRQRSLASEFLGQRPSSSNLREAGALDQMSAGHSSAPFSGDNASRLFDNSAASGSSRSKLRAQLRWIYGSWYTMAILAANVCGALLTLYVLTLLLLRNCDGSLDRENQGIRSMHLLAVIVVFFGSTLFIVHPTPGLCLLRTSWHNFSLVLLFGSLLLQTMQTRTISSIGLGGRPNRLNQFLTLVFMVSVQVSFELQRWKYESANYVNFLNQYFGSHEGAGKKLVALTSSTIGHFNPLDSFNDQVTPINIQVSEKYQNLLHDYCSQPVDDFLHSQIYLWILIGLLVVLTITARRKGASGGGAGALVKAQGVKSKLRGAELGSLSPSQLITSGKLLACQHEANLLPESTIDQAFGPFGPSLLTNGRVARRHQEIGNVFLVTLLAAPIYFASIVLRVHGQHLALNHDLVSSATMVAIAFTILIGAFLPLLRGRGEANKRLDRQLLATDSVGRSQGEADLQQCSMTQPIMATRGKRQRGRREAASSGNSPQTFGKPGVVELASPSAFAMFPEFASTGLRRPSSISGESGSHGAASGGSRRQPFAETKESRRQMGLSLANLPAPSADSLRNLCVYNHRRDHHRRMSRLSEGGGGGGGSSGAGKPIRLDPGFLNLKLNLAGIDDESAGAQAIDQEYYLQQQQQQQHNRGQQRQQQHQQLQHGRHHNHHEATSSRRSSSSATTGEKRLIMLDVDPCCPRHGVGASGAWTHRHNANGPACAEGAFSAGGHGGDGPAA